MPIESDRLRPLHDVGTGQGTNALTALLDSADPAPFTRLKGDPDVPLLVLCDHASNAVPRSLGDLGIDAPALASHIAWDIGARRVAETIVERIGGTGVLAGFSRLVIDCNRPLRHPTLVPETSDGIVIPANRRLDRTDIGARIELLYLPYHFAIVEALADFASRGIAPTVLCVHSCTPVMNGFSRPWSIGVAHSPDDSMSRLLMETLRGIGDFDVGDNQPYAVDETDFTVIAHGLNRGLKHALIEIRQDLIADDRSATAWGELMCNVLGRMSIVQ